MTSLPDVREQAQGHWPHILGSLGIEVRTDARHGPCPVCGGKDRFRFDDKDGRGTWFCNQCEPQAGDGFHLVQKYLRCDFPAAKDRVAGILGYQSQPKHSTMKGSETSPRMLSHPPNGILGQTLFLYADATEKPIIYVQRIDHHNGGKYFCQWGPTQDGTGWQSNLDYAPKPRPLYRLHDILSDQSSLVVIHEGEKAAEAARQAQLSGVHTTTLSGARSPHLSNFQSLAGRSVVICPDQDQDGKLYAEAVTRLAEQARAASIRTLRLPGLPPKGDIVEWLQQGGTTEQFTVLLEEAGEGRPSEEGKPRILDAVVRFEELLSFDLPERKEHLAWLREGSLAMVFGPRGIGKTMLQLGLTAGLVTGTKFLSWPVTAPIGVLYIDGEMPLDELRKRIIAILVEPPKASLHFLTSEVVYHKTQRDLILTDPVVQEEITIFLDAHPEIRVVILDNISSLFVGIDEDRKRDWEPINAWLVRLRHRGLAVVLVHHAGKGGHQRGTSGREDALDIVIQLDRPAQYDAREGCHFELRFTKSRSVKGDDVIPLDIKVVEKAAGVQLEHKPLEESKLEQVRRLFEDGIASPTDIAEELGISKGHASRLLKKVKGSVSVMA